MRKITKRSAAVITAAVVAVGAAGAAWAVWGVNGVGTASASAGNVLPLGVGTAITLNPPAFFPGSQHSVAFTVTNPNPFPVEIQGITITDIDSGSAACADDNVLAVAGATPAAGAVLEIPANTTIPQSVTYNNAIRMIADAANGCKTVPFTFKVNVQAGSDATDPAPVAP
ncbi:LEA type 2 family protein [Actinoplanes sp. CA-252034]|uniref:NDR1/HIN1-like protein n=1 Tax=Actinoplanes sp. CA-252034 TaxID=3239906 RepID=UPI003D96DDD0